MALRRLSRLSRLSLPLLPLLLPRLRALSSFVPPRTMAAAGHINTIAPESISFIDAALAKTIDEQLMANPGFSIDQLMELAGYSVACAAHEFYTESALLGTQKIAVLSGPGNNGGDGLVAARHLRHFGYSPVVFYPRTSKTNPTLFANLVHQCQQADIDVVENSPTREDLDSADLVIDALFGFSFVGPPRSPYSEMISDMATTTTPILAVDVPSGWHVEDGDVHGTGLRPAAAVSLTLPKACMKGFSGVHFLGGRFVPDSMAKTWNVTLPEYGLGPNQIVRVAADPTNAITPASAAPTPAPSAPLVSMFSTAPTLEEARAIADALVREKLVACVNLLPQVTSLYEWEGRVEAGHEVLMMIKTRQALAVAVTARIKQLHSYQVPETIVLDIDSRNSNPDYVQWVVGNTRAQV